MVQVNLISGLVPELLLAQDGRPANAETLLRDILPWLLMLIGLILAGGVLILFLRRRLHEADSSPARGFTLHDLRQLHAAGELTDEEYERAKAQMIGSVKTAAQPKPDLAKSWAQPKPEDDAYRAGKLDLLIKNLHLDHIQS